MNKKSYKISKKKFWMIVVGIIFVQTTLFYFIRRDIINEAKEISFSETTKALIKYFENNKITVDINR